MFLVRKLFSSFLFYAAIFLLFPYLSFASIIDNIQAPIETADSLFLRGGSYEVNSDGAETEKNFNKNLYIENYGGNAVVMNVIGNGTADSAKISAPKSYFGNWEGTHATLNVSNGGTYDSGEGLLIAHGRSSTGTLNVNKGGRVNTGHLSVAFSNLENINGTINVEDEGSSITTSDWLTMGAKQGNATVNITNGGLIKVGHDDSEHSASLQFGGLGSATSSVNVHGRSIQVQTNFEKLDDIMNTGTDSDVQAFISSLNLDIFEEMTFDYLNQKYFEFVGNLMADEYQTLKSEGKLSTVFFESLGDNDKDELLSNSKFATKTESRSSLIVDDTLQNGSSGFGDNTDATNTINISDYGLVETDRVILDGDYGQSTIDVSDYGELKARYIMLGATSRDDDDDPAVESATLSVRNTGVVKVDEQITVYHAGTLKGDGTIIGNVRVAGGTVAPGNSPGILNIDGDFIVDSGTLEIEIDSLTDFDIFNVTGFIYIGDSANILFWLNDTTIDSISILDFFRTPFGLNFHDDFDPLENISFAGLTGDAKIDFNFLDTEYVFTADGGYLKDNGSGNGNAGAVPEPNTMVLFCLGLISLTGISRRKA